MSDDDQGLGYHTRVHDFSDGVEPSERYDQYDDKRKAALAYLGDRYLLAKPQNRRPT